jgi:hypothetical protein
VKERKLLYICRKEKETHTRPSRCTRERERDALKYRTAQTQKKKKWRQRVRPNRQSCLGKKKKKIAHTDQGTRRIKRNSGLKWHNSEMKLAHSFACLLACFQCCRCFSLFVGEVCKKRVRKTIGSVDHCSFLLPSFLLLFEVGTLVFKKNDDDEKMQMVIHARV